jgi:GT2 family glycosyltransferase
VPAGRDMISVIICGNDPAKFAAAQASYAAAMGEHPWEIIGIHDAKSLAEGYNRGFSRSRGQIVIFSHDDVEILDPDFRRRLITHLERFDLIGVAGTDRLVDGRWQSVGAPHLFGQVLHPWQDKFVLHLFGAPWPVIPNIQALDGVFLAARRSVPMRIAFDSVNFDGFHFYDVDFSFQAYRAGMKLAVANDIHLLHYSMGKYNEVWKAYGARFNQKWKSHFSSGVLPEYQIAVVQVDSKETALEIMNPPYWSDEP